MIALSLFAFCASVGGTQSRSCEILPQKLDSLYRTYVCNLPVNGRFDCSNRQDEMLNIARCTAARVSAILSCSRSCNIGPARRTLPGTSGVACSLADQQTQQSSYLWKSAFDLKPALFASKQKLILSPVANRTVVRGHRDSHAAAGQPSAGTETSYYMQDVCVVHCLVHCRS